MLAKKSAPPPPPVRVESENHLQDPEVTIQIDQKEPIPPNGKVTGTVKIVVRSEKMTRGVVVHCYGGSEVKLKCQPRPSGRGRLCLRRYNRVTPMEEFSSTEVFVDSWRYLLGKPGIREFKLTPAESRTIPFSFTLPSKLATSYVGKYGRVEYRIQVKVKGFGESVPDEITEATFDVQVPVNLNDFHDAWRHKSIAARRSRKNLGIHRGLIGYVLEVKHGGVVVGQCLEFVGELANTTKDWKVERVEVRLFRSDLFAGGEEKKWIKECIWEGKYPGVDPGRIKNWNGIIGPIPEGPLTNLGASHIIRLSYWIQVCMIYRTPCVKRDQTLIAIGEIVVGNVPFDDELMVKYHEEHAELKQRKVLRMRYRASIDEILGQEPSVSYFVNFSEQLHRHTSKTSTPSEDSSD